MKRFLTLMVLVLAYSVSMAAAQDVKKINGGTLNGKARSLPKPAYPESAKAAKAEGMIAVEVEIDENGIVISAKGDPYDQRKRTAEDGTALDPVMADTSLVQAAEEAALRATFGPTLLSGKPVRVTGRIVYNFVSTGAEAIRAAESPRVLSGTEGDLKSLPKTVSGGVLNGKAISLPAPGYPPAALAVNAEGAVTVRVILDESGSVIAAAAVSGHPLLRAAAENAAREAKFSPTYLSDQPVKVSGVVTYNFVATKKAKIDQ